MLPGVLGPVTGSPRDRDRRNRTRSTAPRLGTIAWAVLAVGALLALAAAPASAREDAAARAENAAATRAYLLASVNLQETDLRNLAQSKAALEAAAAHIADECPRVLSGAPPVEREIAPITSRSDEPMSPRAMGEEHRQSSQRSELKSELSFALGDAEEEPDREATAALIRALTPLRWSNPLVTVLLHLVATVAQAELELPVPSVCADMDAWVSSGYRTLSIASKELARRTETILKDVFEAAAIVAQGGLKSPPQLFAPYENASDRVLALRSQTLSDELHGLTASREATLKRLELAVGLPAPEAHEHFRMPARSEKKPTVIARGTTAAGGRFVVRAQPQHRRGLRCTVDITIEESSHPHEGLLELLNGEGTGRCPSRSHIEPEPAVQCDRGLLVVEANLPSATRSVRLLLSDHRTITSSAIRVPVRLGGPVGVYYQVVRGPSPIPVSLTELDAQDNTLAVLKLPAVVECTKHPVKYFPGGRVRLVHESLPQGPSFTIRAERYRKLGAVHFELKFEASNEELLFGGGGEGGSIGGAIAIPNGSQTFEPQASSGCQPQPYAIIYGLLKDPGDTVLARVSGALVPLHQVVIPAHLHAGGVLVYGAFSPLPTELLVRNASGKTVDRKYFGEAATSDTETCEGEAE
jgi:hypothetical protein